MEANGIDVIASFSAYNYSARKINSLRQKYGDSFSLVFHGGGNFGDLYGKHQQLRLAALRDFPGMDILWFPQTVYYDDKTHMKRELEAILSNYTRSDRRVGFEK